MIWRVRSTASVKRNPPYVPLFTKGEIDCGLLFWTPLACPRHSHRPIDTRSKARKSFFPLIAAPFHVSTPLAEGAAWRESEASEMWHRHRLQTDGSRSSWQCNPAERDYAMYLRSLFSRLFQQMAEIPVAALLNKPLKRFQCCFFVPYPTAEAVGISSFPSLAAKPARDL